MSYIMLSFLLAVLGFCLFTGIQGQCTAGNNACLTASTCTNATGSACIGSFSAFNLPDTSNSGAQCQGNGGFALAGNVYTWNVSIYYGTFLYQVGPQTTCTLTPSSLSGPNTGTTFNSAILRCNSTGTSMSLIVEDSDSFSNCPTEPGTPCINAVELSVSISATTCVNINIVGDPQFRGFRGQSYQIHGIDGGYYNLITSELTQVNGKFAFLSEGKCPIIDGIPAINCWSHPGSYIGSLGIQQIVDGKVQQLLIESGSAQKGFAAVVFNNAQIKVGQSVSVGSFSFIFTSSHAITVELGNFTLTVDNSDMFLNQAVAVNVPLSRLTSHGLLGQTHARKIYPNQWRYIEGSIDDYLIGDDDVFGTDFIYNQFQI